MRFARQYWPIIVLYAIGAVLVGGMFGCVSAPTPQGDTICLSRDIAAGAPLWTREAHSRFPGAVVFTCHGNTDSGEWLCSPDDSPRMPVRGVVKLLQKLYPGRTLVLNVCNEARLPMSGFADVWYAKGLVWSPPHLPGHKGDVTTIQQFEEAR